MAAQFNRLSVFIASPGDVKDERESASRVISELNRMLDSQRIELRPVMWEYDAVTQIGDRPQAVVNEQIADSCDIFLDIMWSRVGAPSGEDVSGTIEEFRRAKSRLDANPNHTRVLFYFCERPLPISVDIEQLAAVRKFRKEVEQLGLISTYSSMDEFELKVRQAVHKHAMEWGAKWGPSSGSAEPLKHVGIEPDDMSTADSMEEIGFLDAIEEASEDAGTATAALEHIFSSTMELTEKIKARTAELNATSKSEPQNLKKLKKISNMAAEHFENYSARLFVDVPIQQKAINKSLERMSDAVLLSQDFAADQERQSHLATLRTTLKELQQQIQLALSPSVGFRNTIAEIPRMTTRFNGARKQTIRAMDEFIDGMQETNTLLDTLLEQVDGILG